MGSLIDLTGQKFGNWTVFSRGPNDKLGAVHWWCSCSCGTERLVNSNSLRRNGTKSCGCIQRTQNKASVRHHKEYSIWKAMIARCYVKSTHSYPLYGGIGITVCDEWKNDFWSFLDHFGKIPYGMTIERIDSRGHYTPKNCTLATMHTQNRNKKNNIWIEYHGIRRVLQDWDKVFGISRRTIQRRLNDGWDMNRIVNNYCPNFKMETSI